MSDSHDPYSPPPPPAPPDVFRAPDADVFRAPESAPYTPPEVEAFPAEPILATESFPALTALPEGPATAPHRRATARGDVPRAPDRGGPDR